MTLLCSFAVVEPGLVRCTRKGCDKEMRVETPPEKCYAACKADRLGYAAFLAGMDGDRCRYLGELGETILAECQTCTGRQQIKIPTAACGVYGRCVPTPIGRVVDLPAGIGQCHGCTAWSPQGPADAIPADAAGITLPDVGGSPVGG